MRATHVIHTLGPGGAENVLVDLARAAPGAGIELSVVSLMATEGLPYHVELERLGVEVRTLSLPTRWDARGLARGLDAIRSLRPEVIHTHLKHADLVGAFAARRLGVPMVSTLHLIEDAPTRVGAAKRWLAAQARVRVATRTVAVSDSLRDWYLSVFPTDPSSVVTIRNGVEPPPAFSADEVASVRAELGVPDDAVMATMVGVMRPGKGHAELLEAARKLPPSAEFVRFVLAGDGPERAALERTAAASGLPSRRIVFAGFRTDVPRLLAASDLVVHPTLFDALPTALIHGLAAGKAAVASDVGGVPEIVTPQTGRLVPAGDVGAFARAVAQLAGDPDTRAVLGAAARRRFEAEFSSTIWARQLADLYNQILEHP